MSMKSKLLNKIEKDCDLDKKVDEFIEWYRENEIKGNYAAIGEYKETIKLRNFIEKMAVWYELNYPEQKVYQILSLKECDRFLVESCDVNSFLKLLSPHERYFNYPEYMNPIYFDSGIQLAHFHVTSDGFIVSAENIEFILGNNGSIKSKDLEGIYITEALEIIKKAGIQIPEDSDALRAIKRYKKEKYFMENLLDCVMYRIIERGDSYLGPRRAYLFAKDFGRNIDIPIMYGMDSTDPNLKDFLETYLEEDGKEDLECYLNYFYRDNKDEECEIVTVKQVLNVTNKEYTKV